MQEAEEQDTCRICGAPAEGDQPLFHPCKCSGTIRYIHQDCLTTWLAHSKRKVCDVCKHPYAFTKVYAPNMPSHLPPLLLLRRLIQQFLFAILFVIRVVVVACMWLAVLPWITVWTWRMYFAMGETTAWWISDRPRANQNETITSLFQKVRNEGAQTFFNQVSTHPVWVSLSADIFSGQIIAACIVLTFVAIFLLREWIAQNARPGLFEDDEFAPEEQRNPAPAPPEPQPARLPLAQRIQNFPDADAFAKQQAEALHALEQLRNRQHRQPATPRDNRRHRPYKVHSGVYRPDLTRPYNGDSSDTVHFPELRRKTREVRMIAAKRRAVVVRNRARTPTSPLSPTDKPYEFTFEKHVPRGSEDNTSDLDSASAGPENETGSAHTPPLRSLFFPAVKIQPPREELPYRVHTQGEPSRNVSSDYDEPGPSTIRRPTLPASTIAMANTDNSFTISPSRTPVTSPGLATYHPPEEFLETGTPHANGSYFDVLEEPNVEDGRPDGLRAESLGEGSSQTSTASYHEHGFSLLTDSETETDEDEGIVEEVVHRGNQVPHDDAQIFFDRIDLDEVEEEEEDDEAGLFFVDREEAEARQARAVAAEGQDANNAQVANGNAPAVNGGAQAVNDNGDAFDMNDDFDGNVEEDMDGALEAVGIQGPIFGVLQNAALMVFVLDTAIGLCIWVPYTIGKTMALLALDPRRCLELVHLPIKGMRIVTDPVVDSIAYVAARFLLPPWINAFKRATFMLSEIITRTTTVLFGKSTADQVSEYSSKLYEQSYEIYRGSLSHFTFLSAPSPEEVLPEPEFLFPKYARSLEPYFAELGKEVRIAGSAAKMSWTELAVKDGTIERIFAVCLGYFGLAVILAAYLNLLTVGNARTAGRAVRNVIRQQLLVVKVAGFIFVELAIFPLGCGVVLDVCTVSLFPEANLQSRVAFFSQAPMTAMFYHWIAGTLFMYSFAILLSGCRSIMRPGAMWFVKDPEDRNAHPIRDILERHTLTQLKKICISGLMYSAVVACLVGSVAGLLVLGHRSILPFRWKNREPLSDVPIDLLFLHLLLPQTMHHFRPKRSVKSWATKLWKYFAKWFRLTSYFFGGRHDLEEIPSWNWWTGRKADGAVEGSFRRVPATDYIALGRDIRATARVNEDGTPYDEEAAKLVEQQNLEAEKAQHDHTKDYMIVYLPPLFRYRLFAFMLSMWSVCAVMFGLGVAVPIQLGRSVFSVITPREVHDGYSLLLGFYLLWACYLFGKSIDRLDKRRQRVRVDDGPTADIRLLVVKRGLLWCSKALYMSVSLGVAVPILLALVMDLYVVLPVRRTFAPAFVPKVRLVDAWALGLVYGKIALHITQLHPPNDVTRGLHHIVSNGWVRLDPVRATKEVIAPVVGGLLGMVLFPGLVLQLVRFAIPVLTFRRTAMLTNLYPAIFVVAGFIRSAIVAYDVLSTWSQSVRDTEFLVELRLRNHDPDSDKGKAAAVDPTPVPADAGFEPQPRRAIDDPQPEEGPNWDAGG